MRERYKMLLTIPIWVPLAMLGCAVNWVCNRASHPHHWQDLKDIIKDAWHN